MTTFTYPTVIYDTSAKRIYQALTNRADMDVYLDRTGPESTWKVGEKVFWRSERGDDYEDKDMEVLVADKPTTLSFTWHSFDETDSEKAASTVVRFDIAEIDYPGAFMVTLTHSGFDSEASPIYQRVQEGWVRYLSSLKTYLESGDADRTAEE